jgi:hypothetical protein
MRRPSLPLSSALNAKRKAMSNVIDLSEYRNRDSGYLERVIIDTLKEQGINLSEDKRKSLIAYGNGLLAEALEVEKNIGFSFTLEIPCTDEQREKAASQILEGVNSLLEPRKKFIHSLIGRLIYMKIREIESSA